MTAFHQSYLRTKSIPYPPSPLPFPTPTYLPNPTQHPTSNPSNSFYPFYPTLPSHLIIPSHKIPQPKIFDHVLIHIHFDSIPTYLSINQPVCPKI